MTVTMQVERLNPTTSNGEGVRVVVTYYSFNKTEIDELEDELREHNKFCNRCGNGMENRITTEVIEAIPTVYVKAIIDSFTETMNHKAANRTASMYADYEMGVIDTYIEVIRQLYGLIKGEYEEKSYVDNV